jgi:hypothetical protein
MLTAIRKWCTRTKRPQKPLRLIDIVLANKKARWNWYLLSKNPNITLQDICANPTLPWNRHSIHENPSISIEQIRGCVQRYWHWNILASNPGLCINDFIEDGYNAYYAADYGLFEEMRRNILGVDDSFWLNLSENPTLTMDHLIKYPYMKWNWAIISKHPNITPEFVVTHREFTGYTPATWLSRNPNITFEFTIAHPSPHWDYTTREILRSTTMANIIAHPEILWDMHHVSEYANICLADVLENSSLLWVPTSLAHNINISPEDIWRHREHSELCSRVAQHILASPNLTMQFITDHPDIKLNWPALWCNSNITLDFILAHPDKSLNKSCSKHVGYQPGTFYAMLLSGNASLTLSDIANRTPWFGWDYAVLSNHLFGMQDVYEDAATTQNRSRARIVAQCGKIKHELFAVVCSSSSSK